MDSKWLDVYAPNHLSNPLSPFISSTRLSVSGLWVLGNLLGLLRYRGKYHKSKHLRVSISGHGGDHHNSAADVNAGSGYQQVCVLTHFQLGAGPLLILACGGVIFI